VRNFHSKNCGKARESEEWTLRLWHKKIEKIYRVVIGDRGERRQKHVGVIGESYD